MLIGSLATWRKMIHIVGRLFGLALGLGSQATDLPHRMRVPHLVIDHAYRERNQRKEVGTPFAIHATNRTAPQILGMIKTHAFNFVGIANEPAEALRTIRCCHYDKIIAPDMADKIIGIAAITHDALADTPHKAYQIIAGEKA